MMAFLDDQPVSRRIAGGLGVLGACVVLVAGAAFLSLTRVSSAFDSYSKAAAEVEAADDLRLRTSDFVGAAKEYAARNTSARYRSTLEFFESVEASRDFARSVAPDPAFIAAVDDSSDALLALRDGFEVMAAARVERNRLVEEELRGPGTRARASLSDLRLGAAPDVAAGLADSAISLLLARDYMNRFLDDFDAGALERSREEIARSRALLAEAAGPAPMVDADLARFEAALDGLETALGAEREAGLEFFDADLPAVNAAIEAMIEIAHAGEDAARDTLIGAKTAAYWAIGAVLLLAAILGGAAGIVVSRSVVRPVKALTCAMSGLAGGDLDITVPGRARKDEMGGMAAALQVLKDNSIDRVRLEDDRVRRAQTARHSQDAIDQLVAMFGKSIAGVLANFDTSSTEMGGLAAAMKAAADDTHAKSRAVAEAMRRAEEAIATIASAAQELTGSVGEIGEQAGRTAAMSKKVRESADGARGDVDRLTQAVARISGFVQLIEDIAEQTNLLALNATIESARAGEAGKGFAVVASEVKALAGQTGKATEEIGAAINGVASLSSNAVAAMERIQAAIADLDEVAETVAAASEEQRAATEEIARSAASLSEEAGQIMAEVAAVESAGAETRDSSVRVDAVSGELSGEAKILSEEVRGFLDGIGDSAVRESVVPRTVRLAATITLAGQETRAVTVVRLSPASVEIDGPVTAPPGARLSLSMPGCDPVTARLAESSDQGARLQLAMERGALDRMERYMMTLMGRRSEAAPEGSAPKKTAEPTRARGKAA
ncbi:methyl-accepting chemotaxis protein [Maricaulaceae bacterium MS644]